MTNPTIITYPTSTELRRILSEAELDIVSPFYSAWTLAKLKPDTHRKVRFITRLPDSFSSPPSFLDNDPKALLDTMIRLGDALSVYAVPTIHAKLYLTRMSVWIGSANFTKTGFSGVGELLLRYTPAVLELRDAFDEFKANSKRVTRGNLQWLAENVDLGLTHFRPTFDGEQASGDVPSSSAISYENFEEWLNSRSPGDEGKYITDRMHNKNFMSGHAYSGYHGIVSFLLKNKGLGRALLKLDGEPIPEGAITRLADFVEKFGHRFGGPRGGTWRSKLSVRLGGVHTSGGAGDTVVKRLLVLIPKYMAEKQLL